MAAFANTRVPSGTRVTPPPSRCPRTSLVPNVASASCSRRTCSAGATAVFSGCIGCALRLRGRGWSRSAQDAVDVMRCNATCSANCAFFRCPLQRDLMEDLPRRTVVSAGSHLSIRKPGLRLTANGATLGRKFAFAASATPPIVQIASPVSGETICGTITVSATAADSLGIVNVALSQRHPLRRRADTTHPTRCSRVQRVADGVYSINGDCVNR